jgi:hypothetical protein|tara:strand:+ start:299 stop:487 length:189 start_codon:yes stop_codon:yes gene_type:complete
MIIPAAIVMIIIYEAKNRNKNNLAFQMKANVILSIVFVLLILSIFNEKRKICLKALKGEADK